MKYNYSTKPKHPNYQHWEVYLLEHLRSAISFVQQGGVAVVLHKVWFKSQPPQIKSEIEKGYPVANVYGSAEELLFTATWLGSSKTLHYPDTIYQHLEVYGHRLRKLLDRLGDDLEHYRGETIDPRDKW